MTPHHETASYRQVDITHELQRRPGTRRDETPILLSLAQTIAERTVDPMQALVDTAMRLTGAQSAGVSVTDVDAQEDVFHWVAVAGHFAGQLGATLPRWFSPCGDTLRTGHVMLMRDPSRHYPYIAELGIPIAEVLLAPIAQHGVLVGTVWVVQHDAGRGFDAEDARLLTCLARFVGDTQDLLDRLSFGQTL